jgi:hypothetical protein
MISRLRFSSKVTPRLRRSLVLAGAGLIIVSFLGWAVGRMVWNRNGSDIARLQQAVQTVPCALVALKAGVDGAALTVTGLASREAEAHLKEVVAANTKALVSWQISSFDGPYCAALELVRLSNGPSGATRGLAASLPDHRTSFQDGEDLVVDVATPDFAAYLTIDYVMSNGSVLHITPGEQYPAAKYGASSKARFGQPSAGFTGWSFQEPFGRDLLVVIASTRPLAAKALDSPSAYISGVRDEVRISALLGEQMAATVTLVDTQQKR